ncbi:MAG: phosphatidylglycerophosphatase A [Rickettsiales bacterium]
MSIDRIIHLLHVRLPYYSAIWFGAGLSPVAPGTVGTLAALPCAFVLQFIFGDGGLLLASIKLFLSGIWISSRYCKEHGTSEDPKEVVIDEVSAMWMMLAFMPMTWQSYAIGFVLFRFFDAVKPWPISLADRKIKGGFGIMFDDLLATLFGLLTLLIASWLIPGFPHLLEFPFAFLRL